MFGRRNLLFAGTAFAARIASVHAAAAPVRARKLRIGYLLPTELNSAPAPPLWPTRLPGAPADAS